MPQNMKLPLLTLLVLAATAAFLSLAETTDPELKQCHHQCKTQQQFTEKQIHDCQKTCDEYYKMKKKNDEQEGAERHYMFDQQHFYSRVETEQGSVWTLPKFTERSKFLRGVENFRISILEANPFTFVTPSHFDAEILFFVVQGEARINVVKEKRSSFDLKAGDIFRVPQGTTFYIINKHENEKLRIVELLQPTSLPGEYEVFHGAGGEDPETFYTAFSWDVLEAALKVPRDKLQRFFKQQKEGSIMKASREQIESMSEKEEMIPRIWPFSEGDKSEGPFNLFEKSRTSYSNKYGSFFEALPHEFTQLRDLAIAISFANITKGSMVTPHYNSKSTKIAMVLEGEGKFQMACPHISSTTSKKSEPTYQKIRGLLKPWTVFIVPAGHPFLAYASPNHNLQIVCFEVNAHSNVKYLLAGKDNVVNKMERMAKELGFNSPGKEVERMFRQQEDEFFFPGPSGQQKLGWAYA